MMIVGLFQSVDPWVDVVQVIIDTLLFISWSLLLVFYGCVVVIVINIQPKTSLKTTL